MHDSEKSDSAIVAVKPPNKAGLPAAEAVERRAGAKGNADQQSTHRTQSRKRVTQALSRVRQARRQTPKVGAGCSNWARPDLRGGCAVMCIPTAILGHEDQFQPPRLSGGCRFGQGPSAKSMSVSEKRRKRPVQRGRLNRAIGGKQPRLRTLLFPP